MFLTDIKGFISYHKNEIIKEMKLRLHELPRSLHRDFLLRTTEGQRRFEIWLDLLIRALGGNIEPFLEDQKRVGYVRAVQGIEFEDGFQYYHIFLQTFYKLLKQSMDLKQISRRDLFKDIQKLNEILFQCYNSIAASFLKTREEQISEKITHLKGLYDFTNEIINAFELEEIAKIILRKMIILFGVEKDYLIICRNNRIQGVYSYPFVQKAHDFPPIIEKSLKESAAFFVDEGGNVYREINLFQLKRIISVPIHAHGNYYGALALVDNRNGFRFTDKELTLLNQFLYVAAIVFENVFVVEEIQQNRQELRLLTAKMINIQEEERRRLASDIHDTIAQTLTGISYKMQFCKELARRNSELLIDQLDALIETVHQAIDQSRELISSLRPDLIDTIGLVPALKRLIDNYTRETGIKILSHLPKQVHISPDINICLFRLAQEGLTNVYKHADTKAAEVILKEENGNAILVVNDKGKGFDMSHEMPWIKNQTELGLLSMKERVEAAGGILLISSKINKGCRIEAKIPLKGRKLE